MENKRILMIGLCCLDTINYVEKYPEEDSDTRVFDQRTGLGGNIANSCVVLRQFTANVDMCASLPCNKVLFNYLDDSKINYKDTSIIHKNNEIIVPHSTVVCNIKTGTRTVLHYRGNLPEIEVTDFITKFNNNDFINYSWIHFEGRNFDNIQLMMDYVYKFKNQFNFKLSVEFEKVRSFKWFDSLIKYVDVIFISKDFAKSKQWFNGIDAIINLKNQYKADNCVIICPWGSHGVYGLEPLLTEPVFIPSIKVEAIDTLAAGDCFIAASIWAMSNNKNLTDTLKFATKIAAKKCLQKGLSNLFESF